MKIRKQVNCLWPLRHLVTAIIITLTLAGGSAWAGKPPKPPPEPPPEPQAVYRLVDLVGPAGGQSEARRVNDSGWVVGTQWDNTAHAFVVIPEDADGNGTPEWFYDQDGDRLNDLLIDLGVLGGGATAESRAFGVNDHGQVVGFSDVDDDPETPAHSFLWQPDTGEMLDLGRMREAPGWAGTFAWSINNRGQVVGWSGYYGFLINPTDIDDDGDLDWYTDGNGDGFNDLMVYLGSVEDAPMDINDSGEIVGTSNGSGFLIRPEDVDGDSLLDWFADVDSDGINDLMILLPLSAGAADSSASAINADGLIVGKSGADVVFWRVDPSGDISEFYNLGEITSRDSTGAWDLNDGGQAVGFARSWFKAPNTKETAFLTENGSLINLADRVVDWGSFDSRNSKSRAFGINNYGMIVGDMQYHAYIAIPVP